MSDAKLGELVVVAIEAKNLSTRDIIGKGDPFVAFHIDGDSKRIKAEKRGGQHPHWDEEVRFTLSKNTSKKLKLQVFNEDKREHILIGDTTVELSEVLEKTEWDSWHEIRYRNKYAGEVLLEMTFYYTKQATQQPPPVNKSPISSAPTSGYPPQNIYPPPNSTSPPPNIYPPHQNIQNVYNPTPPSSKPPQFNEPKRSQSSSPSQYPPVSSSSSGYPPQSQGYPPQSQGYPPQSQGYPPAPGAYPPVSSPPGSYPPVSSSSVPYPPISSSSVPYPPSSSGSSQSGGISFPVPVPTPANPANPANPAVSSAYNSPYPPPYGHQSPYPPNNIYPPPAGGNIYPPPNNNTYNQGYPPNPYPPY